MIESTEENNRMDVKKSYQILVPIINKKIELLTAFAILLLPVAVAFPFIVGDFFTGLLIQALIFGIFAISVDILWGYAGILSFGQAVFFGLGAYIAAKIMMAYPGGSADYFALLLATIGPGMIALVIAGILFYRGIKKDYFTIITLTLGIIAGQIANTWSSVTGGYNGLVGVPSISIGVPFMWSVPLSGILYYFAVLSLTIGVFMFTRRTVNSPFGRALMAINRNEQKARALGYNVKKHKTLAFALAGAIGGFAGALYAGFFSFVDPSLLGFALSTQVLIWVLVGGRETLIGPVLGTVFLKFFESTVSGIFAFTWVLFVGFLLVIAVLALPKGLVEIYSRGIRRLDPNGKPL